MLSFINLLPSLVPLGWLILAIVFGFRIAQAGSFWAFMKSVFSDGGQGSFSRVSSGVIIAWELFIYTYCIVHRIPLPFTLGEATLFATAPYGMNKLPDLTSSITTPFGKAPQTPPANPPQQ